MTQVLDPYGFGSYAGQAIELAGCGGIEGFVPTMYIHVFTDHTVQSRMYV